MIVQHEFGLFGGDDGDYLLDLLRGWHGTLIVTLHTTLSNPSEHQRQITHLLCTLSSAVVVMSERAKRTLTTTYSVDSAIIERIPHGTVRIAPSRESAASAKARLGVAGRPVLLTAGFIGPNKGIEYALEALVEIAKLRPNTLYAVVGETHPQDEIARTYRLWLETQVHDLNLSPNVQFVPRFICERELVDWLMAADVCLLPYVDPDQVSSGLLTRCLGLGRAVVATAFPYAEELLADKIGVIVPMRHPRALARAVESLLDSPERLAAAQDAAFEASSPMAWDSVARMYLRLTGQCHTPYAKSRS
jgi:glycosyltransferase involved in cell wall biosynthesis